MDMVVPAANISFLEAGMLRFFVGMKYLQLAVFRNAGFPLSSNGTSFVNPENLPLLDNSRILERPGYVDSTVGHAPLLFAFPVRSLPSVYAVVKSVLLQILGYPVQGMLPILVCIG